jgi:hypothetical protein
LEQFNLAFLTECLIDRVRLLSMLLDGW